MMMNDNSFVHFIEFLSNDYLAGVPNAEHIVIMNPFIYQTFIEVDAAYKRREVRLNKRGIRSHFNSAEWEFLK